MLLLFLFLRPARLCRSPCVPRFWLFTSSLTETPISQLLAALGAPSLLSCEDQNSTIDLRFCNTSSTTVRTLCWILWVYKDHIFFNLHLCCQLIAPFLKSFNLKVNYSTPFWMIRIARIRIVHWKKVLPRKQRKVSTRTFGDGPNKSLLNSINKQYPQHRTCPPERLGAPASGHSFLILGSPV